MMLITGRQNPAENQIGSRLVHNVRGPARPCPSSPKPLGGAVLSAVLPFGGPGGSRPRRGRFYGLRQSSDADSFESNDGNQRDL